MFYFGNFGTVQKSELELLLFSEYLEKILRREEDNVNAYSDYTLSKCFGISQQRISNLKVKKELRYPYEKFDWKKSFLRLLPKARIEDEKINLYIPDANVYLEIKNAGLNFGIKALASLLGKVPVAGSYLEEALPEFTESIENSVSAKIYKKGLENKKSSV